MPGPVTFAAAASVPIQPDTAPATFAMPPVDTNNTDTTVTLGGTGSTVWIAFAAGAAVGPAAAGCLQVNGSRAFLLSTNAAALAASVGRDAVRQDIGAGAATAGTVLGMLRGGTITITRGTAAATTTF